MKSYNMTCRAWHLSLVSSLVKGKARGLTRDIKEHLLQGRSYIVQTLQSLLKLACQKWAE